MANERPLEDEVIKRETTLALQQAGEKISLRLRQVLLLRYQAELSLEEISAELDIPVGTVKSRLHRARHKLCEQVLG